MAMFKALLRMGVAAGAKAAAEPMRREAIASFMLTVYLRVGIVRVASAAEDCSSGASDEAVLRARCSPHRRGKLRGFQKLITDVSTKTPS